MNHDPIEAIAAEASEAFAEDPEAADKIRGNFVATLDIVNELIAGVRDLLERGYEPAAVAFALDEYAQAYYASWGGTLAVHLALQDQLSDIKIPDNIAEGE